MKHNISLSSENFKIRPVDFSDAETIVLLRTNPNLSRFIHQVSPDAKKQIDWIDSYFKRENDFYFAVENIKSSTVEGFIGLYDIDQGRAEWGRWILKEGSLAASESSLLIYKFGLEVLGLEECYCRTISNNEKVISFHNTSGAIVRRVLHKHFVIDGKYFDAIEHYVDETNWEEVKCRLSSYALKVKRLLK